MLARTKVELVMIDQTCRRDRPLVHGIGVSILWGRAILLRQTLPSFGRLALSCSCAVAGQSVTRRGDGARSPP